jgi:hypothetical protein
MIGRIDEKVMMMKKMMRKRVRMMGRMMMIVMKIRIMMGIQ